MEDGTREFFTSEAVKLELLPKPTFEKRRAEVEFYNAHFSDAEASEPFSAELGRDALSLAKNPAWPRWTPCIWPRPSARERTNSSPANRRASRCSGLPGSR